MILDIPYDHKCDFIWVLSFFQLSYLATWDFYQKISKHPTPKKLNISLIKHYQ
ncbi:hypothetical protein NSP_26220 [Nodularia spumigena CCY9414]|nr:hypothetical protein NSP_26220 [Nodularia spumigena CCY9414]